MTKQGGLFLMAVAIAVMFPMTTSAVDFGPNSSEITNPYFPVKVGAWSHQAGAGSWTGRITYAHAIGVETISGAVIENEVFNDVDCLKFNLIQTNLQKPDLLLTLWIAQDTDGNVWVMKIQSPALGLNHLLGTVFFSQFMPAVPAVGAPAAITVPETAKDYCQVVEVDVPLDTTFASYEDCIKVHCFHESPDATEVNYYCPNIGLTRDSSVADPTGVLDRQAFGTAVQKRAVVIPLGG